MSGWRCLAGVGYLVVFDAMGIAVSMVERKEGAGWSSIRNPFGYVISSLLGVIY